MDARTKSRGREAARAGTLPRRALLAGGLGLASSWVLAGRPGARLRLWRAPELAGETARALVLVQLRGGNDGLSTVVPHGDDRYQAARERTRVLARDVLAIDRYRGLHPALERTWRHFREGRVALVEGAGYPRPSRSHFKSMDVWHTARPSGRSAGEGWIGRLARVLDPRGESPQLSAHVGLEVPFSLHSGQHPPLSFRDPSAFRRLETETGLERYPERPATGALGHVRATLAAAQSSSRAVRAAAASYRPRAEYPADGFARSLRAAAAVLAGRIGTRIVSVELDGFDTHSRQAAELGPLLGRLDAALGAFLEDLAGTQLGRSTLVLAFSEFGRRVRENRSGGTDHGAAGPMLLAGEPLAGGLYGRHPSLDELDEVGDLVFTTDFRSVYATVLERWFEIDSRAVLEESYPLLDFLPPA